MLFGEGTLLQLKNEHGGLQTLLRNHYHIFKGLLNFNNNNNNYNNGLFTAYPRKKDVALHL